MIFDDGYGNLNNFAPLESRIRAISYATKNWMNSQTRIHILNASWWRYGQDISLLPVISNYPGLFVWSAGNQCSNVDNYDTINQFKIPNLISVGARDKYNERSVWDSDLSSNYGNNVDIFAPGGKGNTESENLLTTTFKNDYIATYGTSFAAPYVAGVAALMLSVNPRLTSAQLKEVLIASADDITISTPDGTQRAKNLNAYKAVHWANPYLANTSNSTVFLSKYNKDYYYEHTGNVPTEYAGKTVTEISSHCFDGANLHEINVPYTIWNIGEYAFANNPSLSTISFPNSITKIGKSWFEGCTKLSTVSMAGITKIEENAFKNCTSLKTIDLSQVREIQSGTFNGCTSLDNINLNINIDTLEPYTFADCTSLSSISMSSVKHVGNYAFLNCINFNAAGTCKFESLGIGAFMGCKELTHCDISNVTIIEEDAFNGCVSLDCRIGDKTTEIHHRAFYNCKNMQKLNIPMSLIYIEHEVFYGCTNIELDDKSTSNIPQPNNLRHIGICAFYGCTNLSTFFIPQSTYYIGEGAFDNTNTKVHWEYANNALTAENISHCLTSVNILTETIPEKAFYDCYRLQNITIPKNVKSIGNSTFAKCTNLNNIYYEASDCEVASGAFAGVGKYADNVLLEIKPSVITLPKNLLSGINNLKEINIPYSITNIDEQAFENCPGLESITVDGANNVYKSENNCVIQKDNNALIAGCKTSIIPDYVTEIGNYAFKGTTITNITLPDKITAIGSYAFDDCKELSEIVLPQSLTLISDYAFSDCVKLNNITLPDNLSHIGRNAFERCEAFTEITIPASVQSIGIGAFVICENLQTATFEDGCFFDAEGLFDSCHTLNTVNLPNSITKIPRFMFNYCYSLKNVNFGKDSKVSILDISSFSRCGLTNITLPESITRLYDSSFSGCDNLRCIYMDKKYIDSSVAIINQSFYNLPNFDGIYFDNPIAAEAHRKANPEISSYIYVNNNDWVAIYDNMDIDLLPYLANFKIVNKVELYDIETELSALENDFSFAESLYRKLFPNISNRNGILLCYDINQYNVINNIIYFAYRCNLPIVITNENASQCNELLSISHSMFNDGYAAGSHYIQMLRENDSYEYINDMYHQLGYFPIIAPAEYTSNLDFLSGVSCAFEVPIRIITDCDTILNFIINCGIESFNFMVYCSTSDSSMFNMINHLYHLDIEFEAHFYIHESCEIELIENYYNNYGIFNRYYYLITADLHDAYDIAEEYVLSGYVEMNFEIFTPNIDVNWVSFWQSLGYDISIQDISYDYELDSCPRYMYYYVIENTIHDV